MNVVDRQALLSEATPRPWEALDAEDLGVYPWVGWTDSTGEIRSIVETEECDPRDSLNVRLIVAAVNEYEALLACEAGLRALVGFLRPDNRHAIHARDALERLDNLREAR